MRLIQLQVYGYGKLINQEYNLENLQLVYGENEAGKSTIMSFIHSILFGFPTRQQTQLRYEPKRSSEYGGKIVCESNEFGRLTIERVKGKAAGDVTVLFEDGRKGGEEVLHELVGKMDKVTYQNIFSFNLEGLQDIHKLKKEELNRYLFSAGSTGTDLLLQMEQQWQKEREQLFKKTGRKPVINSKLNELKAMDKLVAEAREKNKEYGPLLEERHSLESSICILTNEKESLAAERDRLYVIEEHWDVLSDYAAISKKLSTMESLAYPAKGTERLNGLKAEWRQTSSYLETLISKQKKLEEKLESVQMHTQFTEELHQVETLLSQQSIFMKWLDDLEEIRLETKISINRVSETIRELNLQLFEKDIPSINTSLLMRERIERSLQGFSRLQNESENLKKQYEAELETMHRIESKCDDLEEILMKEEDYQALQKKMKQQSVKQVSLQQKIWVENQIDEREKELRSKRKSFSQQILYSGIAALILTAFLIWGLLNDNSLGAFLAFLIISLLAINGWKTRQQLNKNTERIHDLRRKVSEISGGVSEMNGEYTDVDQAERTLREQVDYRSEWKQRILQLEEQESKLKEIQKHQEAVQTKLNMEIDVLEEIKAALRLPHEFPLEWVKDAFEEIKELVQTYEKLSQLRKDEHVLQKKVDDFSNRCEEWFVGNSFVFTTMQESFVRMKGILHEAEKKKLIFEQTQSDLEPLLLEREQAVGHLQKVNSEIDSLIQEAGCADEEEFRKLALKAEEREEFLARYEGMKTRINQHTLSLFSSFECKEDVTKRLKNSVLGINELIQEISQHQKELASVEHEIKRLEEGSSYSKLLQEFQDKKAELQEYIMKWSKYTLAQESLHKTIYHYQQTKMPNVIKLAEEDFTILTNEAYKAIHLTENEMVEVERKDGTRFQAIELSQGTKEQLYIAIRFALVQSFKDIYRLPIIIDDGAVNFDSARTEAFVELLRKMGKEHQILLFTCHPHIRDCFEEKETLILNTTVPV
ncbi:AAA family ATPase [Mangrovibacillus sp. Mu-81]|jgi:uncharacterized protein YhaN|uniref:ATP-binding protein n=1 Tax=Mangrovibacillus sp. Mu-81 TaxID=3121478 RepID=UPI002FE47FC8